MSCPPVRPSRLLRCPSLADGESETIAEKMASDGLKGHLSAPESGRKFCRAAFEAFEHEMSALLRRSHMMPSPTFRHMPATRAVQRAMQHMMTDRLISMTIAVLESSNERVISESMRLQFLAADSFGAPWLRSRRAVVQLCTLSRVPRHPSPTPITSPMATALSRNRNARSYPWTDFASTRTQQCQGGASRGGNASNAVTGAGAGFLLARDALRADDPRTVIDQWTGMVQAVFIVYWLARWSRVWLLVLNVRTYRASEDIQTVHRLVDTANKEAGEGRAWMFGSTELWHRRQVPRFVVLWKGRLPFLIINAITSHMGYNTHIELTAYVVGLRGSAPVVQEPEADDKNSQEGVITVLEPGSNDVGDSYLEEFPQTAIDSDVPAQAAQAAMTAAATMEDAYIKSKCKAKVFILKGSPGCGKSMAVRALAMRLNATIYGLYNPTRTGECIWTLLAKYPSKSAPLLIAFEERDVPLA
eukprot:gene23200-30415_t